MLKGCSAMKIATWNINSVRLREGLVARLMTDEQPDILCLQEAADVFKFNDLSS
jgi:exonuclease III